MTARSANGDREMSALLNTLLAANNYNLYYGLSLACVILTVICAFFVIIVVMIQPGNSNGISALDGTSDTFYGKNKSKTVESKLKKLTVICIAIMTVLMIAFYLIAILLPVS